MEHQRFYDFIHFDYWPEFLLSLFLSGKLLTHLFYFFYHCRRWRAARRVGAEPNHSQPHRCVYQAVRHPSRRYPDMQRSYRSRLLFCEDKFTLLYTLVQTCVINFVYLFTLYIDVHVPTYMYIMDCKGGNPVSATGVGSNGPWEINRSPRLEVAFRPYVSGNFLA